MFDRHDKEEMLEPLHIALKLEHEGRRFFLQAAADASSALVRQTFEFLAEEEVKHIQKIEQMCQSIEGIDRHDLFDVGDSDAESKLASFLDKLGVLQDEVKTTESDTAAYRAALKFENGAEEFYAEQLKKNDHPNVKKFYKWLLEEESMHSELLSSCLKFVEDPAEWFRRHKSS
jgi:rubrerythrin